MQGWSFTPYYGGIQLQNQMQEASFREQERQRLNQVAEQEIDDTASANESANARLNQGALARTRRAAGGAVFRRRGSAVAPNQLTSGLGAVNAKARAAARRAQISTDINQQRTNYYASPASKWNNGVTPVIFNN